MTFFMKAFVKITIFLKITLLLYQYFTHGHGQYGGYLDTIPNQIGFQYPNYINKRIFWVKILEILN